MLTFDNFKQVFAKGKKPYWILYKGNGKGVQIGSYLGEDGEDAEVESSLQRLEEIILLYGDGIYTVDCRSSKTASRGNDNHTFMYGDAVSGKQAVSGATAPAPTAHPASGFFQGLDAKYFLEQSAGYQSQLQAAQMEIFRRDMQIERLKMEAKTKESGNGSIGGFLEKNPSVVRDLIGIVTGAPAPVPARVGVLRTDQPIPEEPAVKPAVAATEDYDNDEQEYEDYEPGKIDLNALFEAAIRIQKAMPNRHVNDIIDAIADYAEENPDQAEQLLGMLQ